MREQINTCTQSLRWSLARHNHPDDATNSLEAEEIDDILKQIVVSYINFNIFRKQSRQFQTLNNFVIFQVVGLAAQSYLVSYFVATSIDTRLQSILIYAMAAVGSTINGYLSLSLYCLKLVEKVMHNMSKLLAHSSEFNGLFMSHPIELWRRQVLTDFVCRKNFSSRLLLNYVP